MFLRAPDQVMIPSFYFVTSITKTWIWVNFWGLMFCIVRHRFSELVWRPGRAVVGMHPSSIEMEFKMKPVLRTLIAATIVAASPTVFAQVAPGTSQGAVVAPAKNFDVFVDKPTGFTFVKLPGGWKFAGKVSPNDMRHLPSTVLTSVVPDEPMQMADDHARK